MPLPIPSRSARVLSAGAALVACSLASAGVPPPSALHFSTIDSAGGFASLGSTTGTFSHSGPASSMVVNLAIGSGSGNGTAQAYGAPGGIPGLDIDLFLVGIDTTAIYTSGVANISFTVTTVGSSLFADLGVVSGYAASWTVDGLGVVDNDTIVAGTHTFVGSFIYSGSGITSYAIGFALAQSIAPAVPLPGASVLAVVGLAGLCRRRRR